MRRSDMALAALLIAAGVLLFMLQFFPKGGDGVLVVRESGKITAVYSLAEDRVISSEEGNCFEIRGGKVKMTQADCPDGLCLNMPEISRAGETIICLPNKVTLCITGGEEAEHDAVAG